jgi:predicted GIY-YIG superfamily endonuclease
LNHYKEKNNISNLQFQDDNIVIESESNVDQNENTSNVNDIYTQFFEIVKNKNKNYSLNYNINNEILDLKFDLFKNISTLFIDFKQNLNLNERLALNDFLKNKQFKIVENDKNTGTTIMKHSTYDNLALEHLNNISIYDKIDDLNIQYINDQIKLELYNAYKHKNISKKLANYLSLNNVCFGKFRFMPKLHKPKFGIRPIINCESTPTSNISLLIDTLLKPLVYQTESYLKDTQHLLQKTKNLKVPNDAKIYSCDFESLYTNIHLEDALNIVSDYVKDKLDFTHLNIHGFRIILNILFKFNYFKYKCFIYKQKSGIAMGTICAPNLANIFVYCLEKKFLSIHKHSIYFYARYIDDILIIVNFLFNINLLINCFSTLTLNVVSDKFVNFLNVIVSICELTGFLIFKMYYKPTNTFSYLLNSSNHPPFIFKNIPYGLFLCIRRICNFLSDYLYYSRKLTSFLLNRGYDFKLLMNTNIKVANLVRSELIPYKIKTPILTQNSKIPYYFKLPYDYNLNNNQLNLIKTLKNIKSDVIKDFDIRIIYSKQFSISNLFIYNFKTTFKFFKYSKCGFFKCLTCYFSLSNDVIYLNNFPLYIKKNSNCQTKNCIYLIKCKRCINTFYIGRTNNISNRIYNHLRSIIKFIPFIKYTVVSNHFKLVDHNFIEDFAFMIITHLEEENLNRLKNIETYYINLFKHLDMVLLNDIIPSKNYILNEKILFLN